MKWLSYAGIGILTVVKLGIMLLSFVFMAAMAIVRLALSDRI